VTKKLVWAVIGATMMPIWTTNRGLQLRRLAGDDNNPEALEGETKPPMAIDALASDCEETGVENNSVIAP
jgi:hypothetical protein